jgi:hypothetical protein
MIKKIFQLLFLCCIISFSAISQTIVQINAGSRAPWGNNQNLLIDNKGHCTYFLSEVNGAVKDSSSFIFSASQLDSFFTRAEQVGFFQLNSKYDGGVADGAGIFISMNHAGKKHSVDLQNQDIPPVNELIGYLNLLLASHKIRIYYGQK